MSKFSDASYLEKEPQQSFGQFLFNGRTGAILGRTPNSWGKIGIFYIFFYLGLAALFSVCMWAFFQTLDPRIPRWQNENSIIGTNPGLGFRPMPPEKNVESTLIWYRGTDRADYLYWVTRLEEFLEVYRKPGLTPGRGQNTYNCDYDRPPGPGQVCDVDVKNWYPCTQENNFNYHKSAPCIFLKLNKIYGWVPEYYNDTRDLPENMPLELKQHIQAVALNDPKQLNTIWVSCEGENPADIENIGAVNYIPKHGFPGFFYPYENSEGYLSPPIAIHLEKPKSGILINIECKAWAKNIKHSRQDKIGSLHLEIMID